MSCGSCRAVPVRTFTTSSRARVPRRTDQQAPDDHRIRPRHPVSAPPGRRSRAGRGPGWPQHVSGRRRRRLVRAGRAASNCAPFNGGEGDPVPVVSSWPQTCGRLPMKAASAKPDRFNLDITKWHLELRHQSQLRPRSVQGEPVTTGGTPAQLCTFRPALYPVTANTPAEATRAAPAAGGNPVIASRLTLVPATRNGCSQARCGSHADEHMGTIAHSVNMGQRVH